jgi:GT2 family glycosyltransferase
VVCTFRRPASLSRLLSSVLEQSRLPDELIVVDASPDGATEAAANDHPVGARLGDGWRYFRVGEPLRGLTRQRNFAVERVRTDLVAFVDDDVVLRPRCLEALESVHRQGGPAVAGVAPVVENELAPPSRLWRWRRRLGIVSTLEPGRYSRSGMSIPWGFLQGLAGPELLAHGDWLPGAAFMWKTALVRQVGFQERFAGYANGEDLEFSLRMGRLGALLVTGAARAVHLHEPAGRPSPDHYGAMTVENAYAIHRTCLERRSWTDAAWFRYAYLVDGLLQSPNLLRPGLTGWFWRYLRGYWRAYLKVALAPPGVSGERPPFRSRSGEEPARPLPAREL